MMIFLGNNLFFMDFSSEGGDLQDLINRVKSWVNKWRGEKHEHLHE